MVPVHWQPSNCAQTLPETMVICTGYNTAPECANDLVDTKENKALLTSIVKFEGIKAQKKIQSLVEQQTGRLWQGKELNPALPGALTTRLFCFFVPG